MRNLMQKKVECLLFSLVRIFASVHVAITILLYIYVGIKKNCHLINVKINAKLSEGINSMQVNINVFWSNFISMNGKWNLFSMLKKSQFTVELTIPERLWFHSNVKRWEKKKMVAFVSIFKWDIRNKVQLKTFSSKIHIQMNFNGFEFKFKMEICMQ